MPIGSYLVSFSLLVGITLRRQPEIEYNNSALDRALRSLCVLGRCLGSRGPWRIREPTFRRQPKIKYNNDALDRALRSPCASGQCLGSGRPRSTRNLCRRRQLQRAQSAIGSHRFNYQIEQVAQIRRFPISYREKTRVKIKSRDNKEADSG